jgi:hypothetical protein
MKKTVVAAVQEIDEELPPTDAEQQSIAGSNIM